MGNGYLKGYKFLLQNGNDTLGIKWNAIDANKFERLVIGLKGFNNNLYSQVNSTHRMLVLKTETFKDKQLCIDSYYRDYVPFAKQVESKVKELGSDILISINASPYASWGYYYCIVTVSFLACPESKLNALFEAFISPYKPLNTSLDHYVSEHEKVVLAAKEKREKEYKDLQDKWEKEKLEAKEKSLTFKPLGIEVLNYLKTKFNKINVSNLGIGTFYILSPLTPEGLHLFQYTFEKGSFGKLKYQYSIIHIDNINTPLSEIISQIDNFDSIRKHDCTKQKAIKDFLKTDLHTYQIAKCCIFGK